MYSIEWEQHALDQLAALPPALPFCAEPVSLLEVAPWSGEAYEGCRAVKSVVVHSQTLRASASEVHAMVQGTIRHGTTMTVEGNDVDTPAGNFGRDGWPTCPRCRIT